MWWSKGWHAVFGSAEAVGDQFSATARLGVFAPGWRVGDAEGPYRWQSRELFAAPAPLGASSRCATSLSAFERRRGHACMRTFRRIELQHDQPRTAVDEREGPLHASFAGRPAAAPGTRPAASLDASPEPVASEDFRSRIPASVLVSTSGEAHGVGVVGSYRRPQGEPPSRAVATRKRRCLSRSIPHTSRVIPRHQDAPAASWHS